MVKTYAGKLKAKDFEIPANLSSREIKKLRMDPTLTIADLNKRIGLKKRRSKK